MSDRSTVVGVVDEFGNAVDFATEAKQDDIITAIEAGGFNIPLYDNIALSYVASGNGAGEIETVTYKVGVADVATLTLEYDSSSNLVSIIQS